MGNKKVVVDLFAGEGGEARRELIESLGYEYITIDNDPKFNCTMTVDIMDLVELPKGDYYWASVPCTFFSVASVRKHWHRDTGMPKSEEAKQGIKLLRHTVDLLLKTGKPFSIENPMGKMRKMPFMGEFELHEISYCQYGDHVKKPTDIWTKGFFWDHRPRCKNGAPCHEAAPRGSRTGTQGKIGAAKRAIVPSDLWLEILSFVFKEYE